MDDFEKLKVMWQVFINTMIPMEQTPGKFWQAPLEQSQIRQPNADPFASYPFDMYIIDDTVSQAQDSSESVTYVHNLWRAPRFAIAIGWPSTHGDAAGWTGLSFGFYVSSTAQTYQWSLVNQNATNVKKWNLIFATDDSQRGFKGSVTALSADDITILREWITVDDPVRDCRFLIALLP